MTAADLLRCEPRVVTVGVDLLADALAAQAATVTPSTGGRRCRAPTTPWPG